MSEPGPRRDAAHVERDSSGFDLSGLGGGTGAGGVGLGGSAATERRRSTSFLPSSALHGPETLVNDEDNELFMSDEFRMYCYKVRIGACFSLSPSILVNGLYACAILLVASSSSSFAPLSRLAKDEAMLRPTRLGQLSIFCGP